MNQRQRKKLSRNLGVAVLLGDTARVRVLLRAGADPERADSDGTTPLYQAPVNGEAEIARLLLKAGASPDTQSRGIGAEGTPLCAAACWGTPRPCANYWRTAPIRTSVRTTARAGPH